MSSLPDSFEFLVNVPDRVAAQSIPYFMAEQEEMIAACVESVADGNSRAQAVPIVQLVTDLTLDILEDPENQPRLPQEISHRLMVALDCVELVVDLTLGNGLLAEYDASFSDMLEVVGADPVETNPSRLEALASAPFGDVSWVGSGALALLIKNHVADDPTTVIANSDQLKAVSRIADYRKDEARERLGYPGIDERYMRLDGSDFDLQVRFTQEGLTILQKLGGLGCPAHAITPDGDSQPVFDTAWDRLVSYCIPPNASIDDWL